MQRFPDGIGRKGFWQKDLPGHAADWVARWSYSGHEGPKTYVVVDQVATLVWLAQEAGQKAAGTITDAIENDPDTDVKKKAVFALSEMPHEEGVPLLIDQARKNRNPVVRKEAIFWLGLSEDPRALDFITSILEH